MFWTILVILVILWLLGLVSGYTIDGGRAWTFVPRHRSPLRQGRYAQVMPLVGARNRDNPISLPENGPVLNQNLHEEYFLSDRYCGVPEGNSYRLTPAGRGRPIRFRLSIPIRSNLASLAAGLVLAACAETSHIPPNADVGPNPTLVNPTRNLIPTVNIAEPKGWTNGGQPVAAAGLKVNAFATGLDHPRWVYLLPNGDVLVAETNGPERPEDRKGIKAKFMKYYQKKAGAGTKSANRITLLRDADGDGTAEVRAVFLQGLNSPFGMALVGNDFYVANTDSVMRFPYKEGETSISAPGVKVADLPGGPINHHWTKNILATEDGSKLYATTGSNSNIAEHGMAAEEGRACIYEIDLKTGNKRIFATGLRNPNGMGWEPTTHRLWTVANERDELGSDLVPDYLTSVTEGAFYGWPYSYYGQHVDERPQPLRPDLVAKAIPPDYALGSHVAALGMAFAQGDRLGDRFRSGVFVGEHGSWNRKPHSGYKVVFVPFSGGKPSGMPVDVLTGFLSADEKANGRPVGVAIDKRGALLVADDVGNTVWRVSASR